MFGPMWDQAPLPEVTFHIIRVVKGLHRLDDRFSRVVISMYHRSSLSRSNVVAAVNTNRHKYKTDSLWSIILLSFPSTLILEDSG